jgi:excisionase family DNA binding protein
MSKLLYTPAEAAQMLSVSEAWLKRKAGEGEIPSRLVARRRLFSHADLEQIATGQQPQEAPARPNGLARRARR